MRVDGDWLSRPATQAVFQMLEDAGHQVFAVGGCVRNALLRAPVSDVDMATDARPEQVIALAETAGLKAIPTGIEHGTVTVVSDHIPHEITTFRRDVETDGRRAVVGYSHSIDEDAIRRDFTMNALYARRDGTVVDPLAGLADLKARRVRFIEDPEARIREDYLRILRYFRFHAWYGDPAEGLDPDALAAIALHGEGLAQISKERIGAEMLKLLTARDPAPAVAAMRQTGVLMHCLAGADDKFLAPLIHLEAQQDIAPDAVRRLAVLGGEAAPDALRLSKKQAAGWQLLRDLIAEMTPIAEVAYRYGAEVARSTSLLRAALFEQPHALELELIDPATKAVFPLKAHDLVPKFTGAALGAELKRLEQIWIDAGFTLDRAALLAR